MLLISLSVSEKLLTPPNGSLLFVFGVWLDTRARVLVAWLSEMLEQSVRTVLGGWVCIFLPFGCWVRARSTRE